MIDTRPLFGIPPIKDETTDRLQKMLMHARRDERQASERAELIELELKKRGVLRRG